MIIKKRQSLQNIPNMQKRFLQTDLNNVNLCHLSPSALLSSGNLGYCIMCTININTIEHEIQRYTTRGPLWTTTRPLFVYPSRDAADTQGVDILPLTHTRTHRHTLCYSVSIFYCMFVSQFFTQFSVYNSGCVVHEPSCSFHCFPCFQLGDENLERL